VRAAVAEGFGRGKAKECALFLRYAIASLAEARAHVRDGIDRGYFLESDCRLASPGPAAVASCSCASSQASAA
jgi:four helix bundle protein